MSDLFEEYGWFVIATIGGLAGLSLFMFVLNDKHMLISLLTTVIGGLI